VLQAPSLSAPSASMVEPVDSFAKILNNSGYCHTENIVGMVTAWKNIFSLVKPDLIIFDYSPTAMLAAREYPVKKMQIGSGFFCPPNTRPLMGLNTLQGDYQDLKELASFEDRILKNINHALAQLAMKPLVQLGDIHTIETRLLFGFQELEYYPDRKDATYIRFAKSACRSFTNVACR